MYSQRGRKEDRATARDKVRSCGLGDMRVNSETDRQTDIETYSSQYF